MAKDDDTNGTTKPPLPPGERVGVRGRDGSTKHPPKSPQAKAKPTAQQTANARRLRRESTEAERWIWNRISGRRLGPKFRRQEPVLTYIGDFVSHECRLVIELDGSQHLEQVEEDERRTRALEAAGYRVIRFWNVDVYEDPDAVAWQIAQAIAESGWKPAVPAGVPGDPLTPTLSPGGRRGGQAHSARSEQEKRELMALLKRIQDMPDIDTRSPDEILGYNDMGTFD